MDALRWVGDVLLGLGMAAASLTLQWYPSYQTTSFSDFTYFTWDPTALPATALWYSAFGASGANIPPKYLSVQALGDGSQWTWTWMYAGLTFSMPPGPVTVQQLMTAINNDTKRSITEDQYQQITGYSWKAEDGKSLTLRQAMVDNQAQYSLTNMYQGIQVISPGVMYIQA